MFSGSFDEFAFAEQAYSILLPDLVSFLNKNQPKVLFPPNPLIYVGKYNASGIVANVFTKNNTLYLSINGQGTVYLSYKQVYLMQVNYTLH